MGHPQWLSDEEQHAWLAFMRTHALLDRRLDQQLKRDVGLSHLQYEILARLSGAPGRELRMAELAGDVSNSRSGVTYQIGQLEQSGLVRRRTSETDVRAVYACLTDKGMALLESAAPAHVALVRELLIDVLTPAEVRALGVGLDRAGRRMLGEVEGPGPACEGPGPGR